MKKTGRTHSVCTMIAFTNFFIMKVILHLEHEKLQTEENFYYPNSYCDFQQFELVFVPNNVGKLIIYKLIAHLECLLKVWYTAYPLIVLEKWKVCGFFQYSNAHKACILPNLWHPHQKWITSENSTLHSQLTFFCHRDVVQRLRFFHKTIFESYELFISLNLAMLLQVYHWAQIHYGLFAHY